jgi:hypothetical protein
VLTAAIVAVKPAVVELAGTVTEAGTVTDESLLERLTLNPPARAAELKVTMQLSAPAPEIDPFAQLSELSAGSGTSCNLKV